MGQTQSYASNRPLKDINTVGGSSGGGGGIKKGISTTGQQKKQSISSVPINFRQRNKIPEQRQKTPSSRNFHPSQKRQTEQKRQSRSQSLDPKAVNQIKTVFGSARCSPRTTTNSKKSISNREKELWNPEKAAAQLIGLQLQNPHTAQQNLLCLVGGKLKQTNTNLNNNIGQSPRPFRKQSGQFCSFDLDFRIYEKHLTLAGLTKHQISILQKMWELSTENEITDCTKNIMSHLLRSNAQMYQFFDLLGLSDREVILSSTFLRQSANFATVLDFVLTNLNNETQKCLGAKHSRLPWPIEPHHWALFTRCFEDNPPKEVFQNAEGHDLWKIMINFIIIQMRIGYERAMGGGGNDQNPPPPPGTPIPSPRLGICENRFIRRESARKELAEGRSASLGPLRQRSDKLMVTENLNNL
uniref:Globin domain-containing protein n=2 Tax=Meloidogyne enterolobii TaxID=390850 RepID=A0A6V7UZR5_MELEN|nr:unnamed protein product [Meloidogyne enterolobii]